MKKFISLLFLVSMPTVYLNSNPVLKDESLENIESIENSKNAQSTENTEDIENTEIKIGSKNINLTDFDNTEDSELQIDDLFDLGVPLPDLEDPPLWKIWLRQFGISFLYKYYDLKDWLVLKYKNKFYDFELNKYKEQNKDEQIDK